MGYSAERAMQEHPIIAEAYQEYLLCRTTQLVIFRKPTGKSDGSEKIVTVMWPTGFSMLPLAGGFEDQSYLQMKMFAAFLRGEQRGQSRMMSK